MALQQVWSAKSSSNHFNGAGIMKNHWPGQFLEIADHCVLHIFLAIKSLSIQKYLHLQTVPEVQSFKS